MPNRIRRFTSGRAALLCALLFAAPAVYAQWEIKPTDGSSIKFGFLMQGQAESVDVNLAGGGQETSDNLFFRRLRILAGGKINDQWSFFFETDSPNLGKGAKGENDIYIQDFVVTYKPGGDAFNLDVGMLLDPVTYESRAPFQYTTATIPALVVAGLVYWIGTQVVSVPLGKGDYRATGASVSVDR